MLTKNYRLPKELIPTIAKKGKRFHAAEFYIKWLPNELANSRFGFVVPKKVDKSAVVRNRIKRVLRAAVVQLIESKKDDEKSYINAGNDYLFVVTNASLAEKKMYEILEELETMLK